MSTSAKWSLIWRRFDGPVLMRRVSAPDLLSAVDAMALHLSQWPQHFDICLTDGRASWRGTVAEAAELYKQPKTYRTTAAELEVIRG